MQDHTRDQQRHPTTASVHGAARALIRALAGTAEPNSGQVVSSRLLLAPECRAALLALLRRIRDDAEVPDADGLGSPLRADTFKAEIASVRACISARSASEGASLAGARLDQLFDEIFSAHARRALDCNIATLAPERGFHRLGIEQRRQAILAMARRLAPRHRLEPAAIIARIEALYDVSIERVTLRAIVDLYRSTWRTFDVGAEKRSIVKLTAVILVNRLLSNAAPLLWTRIFDGRSFNAEWMVGLGALELLDAHSSKYETELSADLLFTVRQRIHALAAKALFVRDLGLSDQYGSGELFDIIWKGEDAYNNIVRSLLFDGVPTLLTIPLVLGGLTVLHPLLGTLGLLSIPAVYALARYTGPKMQLAREEALEKKRAVFTRGNTMIEGIETLLAQGHLAGGRRSFLDLVREVDAIDRDMIRKWAAIHLWQRYPVAITGIVSALVGAYLTRQGAISPGGVITTVEYATRLRTTVVDMIHRYFEQFPKDVNDAKGLQRLLDWSIKAAGDENAKRPASTLTSTRIECRGLAYKDIVRNLNIAAEPGEFVTISGTSGIGKTTLLRLIAGLYQPKEGVVSIGGVPVGGIRSEGPDSLFTLLAISSQSPHIFDDMTLRQNLALFNPDPAVNARAAEVLDTVGLKKLVPDLDTPGKRRLSGGERVRFGLARALLKIEPGKPLIMLLDEPTASLAEDGGPGSAEAIRRVLAAVHRDNPQVTIVCVTHDRDLIRLADRDIALSKAEVADVPPPPSVPTPEPREDYVALPGIVVDYSGR